MAKGIYRAVEGNKLKVGEIHWNPGRVQNNCTK